MNLILLISGGLILLIAFLDAIWTTLWVGGGASFLSIRVTHGAWTALRHAAHGRHMLLSLAGPLMLLLMVGVWVFLLLLGWTFVFASDPAAVVDAQTGAPADWPSRVYFVGFTLFTLGIGDLVPGGEAWRIATVAATASGLFLVTLAITYLISIIGAVVRKRSFASQVSGLANGPEALVIAAWNGRDLAALDLPLNAIAAQLTELGEQHLTYPVLQYYHARSPSKAMALAVAMLDEAMTLIRFGVSSELRPNPLILRSARAAVADFLETLPTGHASRAGKPPPPSLAKLRAAGIPTIEDAAFREALERLGDRRRNLAGIVVSDGWRWGDIAAMRARHW